MPSQSITPPCRVGRWRAAASYCRATAMVTVFTMLLLAGCRPAPDEGSHRLELIDPGLAWSGDRLVLVTGIDLALNPALIEALEHGVTLPLAITMQAYDDSDWWPGYNMRRRHRMEIRYLPMIRHYQLDNLLTDTQTSYPRLSMLLEELAEPTAWPMPLLREEIASGRWRIRAQLKLDLTRLPAPMRLPVWFDPRWRLDSGWQAWQLPDIGAGDD